MSVQGKAVQALLFLALVVFLGALVVRSADGWADWVVFGMIVVTFLGFAIAVKPEIYRRRARTITREGGGPRRSSGSRP